MKDHHAFCILVLMMTMLGLGAGYVIGSSEDKPPAPIKKIIEGKLLSAIEEQGAKHLWLNLEFEGGQKVSVLWTSIPLYIGQYQEITIEHLAGGYSRIIDNYCPAHEELSEKLRTSVL